MGMTIDEHIKRMGDIRSNYDKWSMLGLTPNEAKAFDVAIETMRKYQKIEKIIDDWNNQKINNIICCLDIKEVLEDGNDA